jgi:hypothetical protein
MGRQLFGEGKVFIGVVYLPPLTPRCGIGAFIRVNVPWVELVETTTG